jgi:predicted RNase H-like nuclease (RuvC/YqgF family)
LLPETGDFTTLKLLRIAKEELSFSEDENKALNFIQDEEMLTWTQEASVEKEVLVGETITEVIKKALKKMDEDKELTEQHISLYEKFIG